MQFFRILRFLKIPIIKNTINEVVEECKFTNLKRKEMKKADF